MFYKVNVSQILLCEDIIHYLDSMTISKTSVKCCVCLMDYPHSMSMYIVGAMDCSRNTSCNLKLPTIVYTPTHTA